MAYGNGKLVAVGQELQGSLTSSDNGMTWTKNDDMIIVADFNPYGIAFGDGVFIVAGVKGFSSSRAYRSTDDGISWSDVSISGAPRMFDIAYGDGQFIIVGYTHAGSPRTSSIYISSDGGDNWNDRKSTGGRTVGIDLQFVGHIGGSKWVAGGSRGAYGSKDKGDTWLSLSEFAGPSTTTSWRDIAYNEGNGRAVVSNLNSLVRFDSDNNPDAAELDAFNGMGSFSSGRNNESITYNNNLCVIVGEDGRIHTNSGTTNLGTGSWTRRAASLTNGYLYEVIHIPSLP